MLRFTWVQFDSHAPVIIVEKIMGVTWLYIGVFVTKKFHTIKDSPKRETKRNKASEEERKKAVQRGEGSFQNFAILFKVSDLFKIRIFCIYLKECFLLSQFFKTFFHFV